MRGMRSWRAGIVGPILTAGFVLAAIGAMTFAVAEGTFKPLFPAISNGKVGFINQEGRLVIPAIFEDGHAFSQGLGAAKFKHLWGYLNAAGDWAIPPQYAEAGDFSGGAAVVKVGTKYTLITPSNNPVLTPPVAGCGPIRDGLARVIRTERTDTVEYVNAQGATIFQRQVQGADDFSDGLAMFIVTGKVGYLSPLGATQIGPQFQRGMPFGEGLAVVLGEKAMKIIDRHGTTKLELDGYQAAHRFAQGLLAVMKDDKWGFIDEYGFMVIPFAYEDAGEFSQDVAAVKVNGKWGYVARSKFITIEPAFDEASPFTNGLAHVRVGEKHGYINRLGKYVWPLSGPVVEEKVTPRLAPWMTNKPAKPVGPPTPLTGTNIPIISANTNIPAQPTPGR